MRRIPSFLCSLLLRDFLDDYIQVMRLMSSNGSNFHPSSPLHRFARFMSKEIKTCHSRDSNHQPPSKQVSIDPRDHGAPLSSQICLSYFHKVWTQFPLIKSIQFKKCTVEFQDLEAQTREGIHSRNIPKPGFLMPEL